jgi:heterodisulfide reductase subunit C
MDVLRIIARREGYVSEKDIKVFYDAFLSSLQRHGRVFEVGILMGYNLRTGHLMADAELGPKIMGKGKIHFMPTDIKGKDQIAKIYSKFQEKRK